ncbi:hypothetical protein N0V88_005280 [Collariella sp. IMI 366227]|nr:hypothetical protein N0V88_005280 [Collariella sp. IMI 366227]
MPQDPNLYGQRPAKKQKKEIGLSGSLAFTSQLSSLLATSSSSSSLGLSSPATTGRTRPSKLKKDDLSNTKIKRKAPPDTDPKESKKLSLKSPLGTEETKAELDFARRKMESKARLYAAMQRGDYIGREMGLVDFDRKWAESKSFTSNPAPASSSSSSDSEPDPTEDPNIDTTLHDWTDEFGRIRRLTHAQILRLERRAARGAASAAELETMSARPKAPDELIYGDAVQTSAFTAHDLDAMEALARKRDRSATPPEATHYQADLETTRVRGTGFYKFSKDEETREKEMRGLEEERRRTEERRKGREEERERRRREIEERKRGLATMLAV